MTAASSLDSDRASPRAALARDLGQSLGQTRYWLKLAYQQVRGKYRRLSLGMVWHPLGFALTVSLIAYLFSRIMGREPHFFFPYLAAGFAAWGLITGCITGGQTAFTGNARHILSRRTPLAMFAWKAVAVAAIAFCMEIPLFFVFCAIMGRPVEPVALMAIPGALLLLANGLWVSLFFGVAVTRFPDLGQLTQSALRVLFLVTPILWSIDDNPRIANVAAWNPFYHAVEMIRGPLMGDVPALDSYLLIAAIAAGGFVITLPLFAVSIRRIPYWL